ncbi:hypothetical protein KR093_007818 [Drosophila rubida]|uniref:procollagen-proline 4-dioxygenase n=1 Tax=Drosophila rubida TaxID=30044 RepID=A0AAD4K7E4_9MUSC|nr:hypothetical protein KR093_007818 [Drosophila rubida]
MLDQSFSIVSILLICSSLCVIVANGEFYSSADKMMELEHVEKELVTATRTLLTGQKKQLDEYRSFVARVKREHEVAKQLGDEYWELPLNTFRLTRRLVEDWEKLHSQQEDNPITKNYEIYLDALSKAVGMPQLDDLRGIARGFVRLQKIYNISASDFAEGTVNAFASDAIFLWRDCYEIGVQLYEQAEYEAALEWLLLASNMLDETESEDEQKLQVDLLEYLALTYVELGQKQEAIKLLTDLLTLDPSHSAQYTLNYLDKRAEKCPQPEEDKFWTANYTILCRGQHLPRDEPEDKTLRCYRDSKRHPIFQLAPLNVEEVHRNPDIHVYHGVLNDLQILDIFEVTEDFTKFRSMVHGNRVSDVRVSQQVWLNYTTPIMQHVNKLTSAISGFDMKYTELMQVADYGIGGQYTPHYDYMSVLPDDYIKMGNRIATVMYYLSDVTQGGYTVFPKLNVFLKPVKGSMVMWHNELRSLANDPRTLHAGCPVIEGFKRSKCCNMSFNLNTNIDANFYTAVSNIWIHSSRQEFRRPCSLNKNE